MAISVTLDEVLVRRKVKARALAEALGITESNLSLLKSGKVKGVKLSTLDGICRHLSCQPGDLLRFTPDEPPTQGEDS